MRTRALFPFFIFAASLVLLGCASEKPKNGSVNMLPPSQTEVPQPPSPSEPNSAEPQQAPTDTGEQIPLSKLPTKKGYPYAIKTKWPGLVKSPYAQDKTLVDVSSMSSGSPARCPHTGKIFIVP